MDYASRVLQTAPAFELKPVFFVMFFVLGNGWET
jgi:hypothetical protein